MFWLAKTIAGMFGLDVSKVQRWVMVSFLVLIGVGVLMFGLWMRSCLTKKPKLDEAAIQKAQQAIAEQDEKKMREVLIESDRQEAEADNTSIEAKANTINAIHESKHKWANATDEDLKKELLRRMNE